jgi:hypothetical protein
MTKTHREGKKSRMRKRTSLGAVQDKTHVGEVHVPDFENRQTTHSILPMPDSTHLEARDYKTYRENRYDAVNMKRTPYTRPPMRGMRTSPMWRRLPW